MAVYAIGDVQGCLVALKALLAKIDYQPEEDQLWFAGDLINRGPESLETLRFIKSLPNTVCVLGNHDIALFALDKNVLSPSPKDTFQEILDAEDKNELLAWLINRPLLHHDSKLNFTLVHAGIHPEWNLAQATKNAHTVKNLIHTKPEFLSNFYQDGPLWPKETLMLHSLIHMRFFTPDGALEPHAKGAPKQYPDLIPWFALPNRAAEKERIVFGHWSTLKGKSHVPNIYPLDTGCVWGGCLTALCLNTEQYFSVECIQ